MKMLLLLLSSSSEVLVFPLLAAVMLCLGLSSCSVDGVGKSSASFESGGKAIQVDNYKPVCGKPAFKRRPPSSAVIVLHGAGGIIFDGPEMRRTAKALAQAGHDVYLLHYFDRTGAWVAVDAQMTRDFGAWMGTVKDAVTWVRHRRGDEVPIGLFGYSLGGFLTVAESFHDPRVSAAVVHAGGIWRGYESQVGHVPPMLLVHGKDDARVEYNRYMPQLTQFLTEKGTPPETAYYEDQGHRFDKASLQAVRQRTVGFFAKHLQTP